MQAYKILTHVWNTGGETCRRNLRLFLKLICTNTYIVLAVRMVLKTFSESRIYLIVSQALSGFFPHLSLFLVWQSSSIVDTRCLPILINHNTCGYQFNFMHA